MLVAAPGMVAISISMVNSLSLFPMKIATSLPMLSRDGEVISISLPLAFMDKSFVLARLPGVI
jgi:hypothetical protein